jgi:hypothetical protein
VAGEETIGKLLLAWFDKPWRAMLTLLISAAILIGLWLLRPTWYHVLAKEPVVGIAVLVAVICAVGLLTYLLEFAFKSWRKASARRKAHGTIVHLIAGLDSEQRQFLRDNFVSKCEQYIVTRTVDI